MTRRASARFTALLTVLALTICATPAWAQTPRAERPAYKVGDKWMRTDGTYDEYMENQVDRAARLAGGRQRPLMKGEIEGTLPLSRAARSR